MQGVPSPHRHMSGSIGGSLPGTVSGEKVAVEVACFSPPQVQLPMPIVEESHVWGRWCVGGEIQASGEPC